MLWLCEDLFGVHPPDSSSSPTPVDLFLWVSWPPSMWHQPLTLEVVPSHRTAPSTLLGGRDTLDTITYACAVCRSWSCIHLLFGNLKKWEPGVCEGHGLPRHFFRHISG